MAPVELLGDDNRWYVQLAASGTGICHYAFVYLNIYIYIYCLTIPSSFFFFLSLIWYQ